MRALRLAAVAVIVTAGCGSDDDSADDTNSRSADAASTQDAARDEAEFEVQSLGLTFGLPDSFREIDNPNYEFYAESEAPRSLITILEEDPSVVPHQAAPGEFVSEIDLGDFDAVVVANADIGELPDGISANELLVSNGDRSFSAIMSASSVELPEFWDEFVRSVAVTPAD